MSILKKMFLHEARFPDEKFWKKDGSSIEPKVLKKPPTNNLYTTPKSLGVHDTKLSEEEMERIVQEDIWAQTVWPDGESYKTEIIARRAGMTEEEAREISIEWWKNRD